MTNTKAHNNPEAFEKALSAFVKKWLGYEFCVISKSDFSLETSMSQGCMPVTNISFTISGDAKRKLAKQKRKTRGWEFCFLSTTGGRVGILP